MCSCSFITDSRVTDGKKKAEKIQAFNILVHRLPEANFELLATISRYLLTVVAHADENKMHERNRKSIQAQLLEMRY